MARPYGSFRPHMGGKPVKGINEIINNLNRQIGRIKDRTLQGLIRVQAKIYQDMDHVPPKIPVEYGNLRKSYFVVTSKGTIYRGESPSFTDERGFQSRLLVDHSFALLDSRLEAVRIGQTKGPCVVLGFSAWYAPYVHEMYNSKSGEPIVWSREGSGPGFWRAAIGKNWNFALKTVAEEARKHERARR